MKQKMNAWIDALPESRRFYVLMAVMIAGILPISLGPLWLKPLGLVVFWFVIWLRSKA